MQRGQQSPGVPRRPEQVGSLDKSTEFARRDKRHIPSASPPNDHCFLIVDNLV
jgi:hypothetical protein